LKTIEGNYNLPKSFSTPGVMFSGRRCLED